MARLPEIDPLKIVESIPFVLSEHFGIEAKSVDVVKTVYRVTDPVGTIYYVKPCNHQSDERIAELHQVATRLSQSGLRLAVPILSRDGRYLVTLDDGVFGYVQPALPGRHADFRLRSDRVMSTAAAAHLHRLGSRMSVKWLRYPVGLPLARKLATKRAAFLRVFPEVESRLPYVRANKRAMLHALFVWDREPSTVALASPSRCFCHRDFAPHNLLVDDTRRKISVIDFDLAGFDHPFVDLVQIVNHSVTLSDVDRGLFVDTVEVYRRLYGLNPAEERWLWQLFSFPDVLVRSVLEWAKEGYRDEGEETVRQAVLKEQTRVDRLTQECPMRLY